ncbi:hypothetical protein W909_08630 [Dickeya zeae EC1]|nr:hypothetical protein W909_08630 [Dickeya zeae EC1]
MNSVVAGNIGEKDQQRVFVTKNSTRLGAIYQTGVMTD